MRDILKKYKFYRSLRALIVAVKDTFADHSLLRKFSALKSFFADFREYRKLPENANFETNMEFLAPCLYDKTENTPVEPVYFYQDSWCAGKVFKNKPERHYDIGSKAEMIGIISEFVPTTMIDIRPIDLELENLSFKTGDVLNLPFKNDEIKSLSSICVLEHIGLGRYGDPLDQFGPEKAVAEIKRVLATGGDLYISLPVDEYNKTYFNAHRAFTRDYIIKIFAPLKLVEERYIYGRKVYNDYDRNKKFGTGLFYFKKI